jgi:DNA-directed RNA polymerase specialized sigma24 family protein
VIGTKVAESDVIQETWIAALAALDQFESRGDGSLSRWIATVLDRKVLDEVRRFAGTEKRDVLREIGAGSNVEMLAGACDAPSPRNVRAPRRSAPAPRLRRRARTARAPRRASGREGPTVPGDRGRDRRAVEVTRRPPLAEPEALTAPYFAV